MKISEVLIPSKNNNLSVESVVTNIVERGREF